MTQPVSALKSRITEDMKSAMRAKEKERLATIRLILAAIKQIEVDTREDLDDAEVTAVLDKMSKQRRESIEQYTKASREDLVEQERAELAIIAEYLPEPLSDEEIDALIEAGIAETGAAGMKDMGKLMGRLKPQIQGRADMGAVSAKIKQRLSG